MNYVIQVLSDNVDGNLIEKSWTNEFTEISYKNVFGLGSICDFPEDIDEGDQFSFLIVSITPLVKKIILSSLSAKDFDFRFSTRLVF